jgi:hypothetical protein
MTMIAVKFNASGPLGHKVSKEWLSACPLPGLKLGNWNSVYGRA